MTDTSTEEYLKFLQGRLMGLRVNRYSYWVHWRELADYFLPRRYKWLVTPNMMGRGSPINQHILDSTGGIYAQRLAAGLFSGKSGPTSPWFRLQVGRIDSTRPGPVALWLAECERLLYLIFSESNFYDSMFIFYHDLVVFGTAAVLIYDDFKTVINLINPCAGEYYVDIDGNYRPRIFNREFTFTIDATVNRFGLDNVSPNIRQLYTDNTGSNRTREIIIAHSIEPNNDGNAARWGFDPRAEYRETYWEWGGSTSPQGGVNPQPHFLQKKNFYEQRAIVGRWDLVSNDAYGRSPAMDALPDQKQIQLEQRRKAQAIEKMVNPPLVADIQLKNQPANLTPGGITYVQGFSAAGRPGFASVYETKFPVQEIVQDLVEVKSRLAQTFFNDILRVASQYETRSNVTAVEWDLRKSESLVMLGPVLERIDNEVLKPIVETVFAIANRAGILPPAPAEVQGKQLNITFQGMLLQAQQATSAASIERVLNLSGQLVGVDPSAMDNIDVDYSIEKMSSLLNNDPKMIRTADALAKIRKDRADAQAAAQQADIAQKLSVGAKNLATAPMSGGGTALDAMTGGGQSA